MGKLKRPSELVILGDRSQVFSPMFNWTNEATNKCLGLLVHSYRYSNGVCADGHVTSYKIREAERGLNTYRYVFYATGSFVNGPIR